MRRCANANFRICGILSAYAILKTQLYVEKYAICGFCNIWDRICDRIFSYNRYPYTCASVQRALLAPEILNESFLKCRYFTALLHTVHSLEMFRCEPIRPPVSTDNRLLPPALSTSIIRRVCSSVRSLTFLGRISRERLEIGARFQRATGRKCHVANRIVTWSTKSSDLEMS